MESVVDRFYQGYGDQQPFNKDGINQGTLQQRGNEYLRYAPRKAVKTLLLCVRVWCILRAFKNKQ